MGVTVDEFLHLVSTLPEAERTESTNYTSFKVQGKGFGYLWPRTKTVGLKQTIDEQIALVAERPDVFEVQFTAGQFGWVVVHLEKIELDELTELLSEAWLLTAPRQLAESYEQQLFG